MIVTTIDSIGAFEQVRGSWEAVHTQDPESTVFTSWPWFRGWLQGTSVPWTILALRPAGSRDYAAFFPLGMHARRRKGLPFTEISIGGNTISDHTGFVCLPAYQREAAAAIAAYLQKRMAWDVFRLRDVYDPKVEALVAAFVGKEFEVHCADGQICPYIPLPESWEGYLQDFLGRRPRKQFRQFQRDFDRQEYRVEIADAATFENYLDILLELYRQRWPMISANGLRMKQLLLRHCFEAAALMLPLLFHQDRPIAGMVEFIDKKNATLAGFITGWDYGYEKISPAKRLQSYVIRYAIENNYKYYDFLRGDEVYKQATFGCSIRRNQDIVIGRKSLKRNFAEILERFSSS
jgi:CelD/BcsL family acetyltransferase involved in cellulose biosynthesis